jgi:hypothetical protein
MFHRTPRTEYQSATILGNRDKNANTSIPGVTFKPSNVSVRTIEISKLRRPRSRCKWLYVYFLCLLYHKSMQGTFVLILVTNFVFVYLEQ